MLIFLLIAAYFFGAIPFGFLVARAKGIDILQFGSGNIGATNVHRALGKWLGLLVFVLDVLKGFLPAVVAFYSLHSQMWAFWVGMAAVGGHCLSPFLRFKGGKGISTGLGALLGSCPLVALSCFGVFVVCLAISRYVSLSSIVSAIMLVPFGMIYHVDSVLYAALGILAAFIIIRHIKNIKRLLNGTESRFSLRGPGSAEASVSPSSAKLMTCVLILFSFAAGASLHIR